MEQINAVMGVDPDGYTEQEDYPILPLTPASNTAPPPLMLGAWFGL